MCLAELEDFPLNTNIGYKKFLVYENGDIKARYPEKTPFIDMNYNDGPYALNEWIEDKVKYQLNVNNYDDNGNQEPYPSGWHIYKFRPQIDSFERDKIHYYYGAERVGIFKVLFDNILAKGWQDNKQVIVAKRMKIICELD